MLFYKVLDGQQVLFNLILRVQVNSCTGKMGKAVIESAVKAGLHIVPVSFGAAEDSGKCVQVGGKEIELRSQAEREDVLASIFDEYPDLIVVDYTVPDAVTGNWKLSYLWCPALNPIPHLNPWRRMGMKMFDF